MVKMLLALINALPPKKINLVIFLLYAVSLLSLVIHFEIYRQTSASAFLNQPELYFRNVFLIRDSAGNSIAEVSYLTGFSSYITAGMAVITLGLGMVLAYRKFFASKKA